MLDKDFYEILNRPPPRPPWWQRHPHLSGIIVGAVVGLPTVLLCLWLFG